MSISRGKLSIKFLLNIGYVVYDVHVVYVVYVVCVVYDVHVVYVVCVVYVVGVVFVVCVVYVVCVVVVYVVRCDIFEFRCVSWAQRSSVPNLSKPLFFYNCYCAGASAPRRRSPGAQPLYIDKK